MGEYINGIKIGTCESLYYARYRDLHNITSHEKFPYLDAKNGFRARFPFPEEDGKLIGHYEPYNKGYLIFINETLAPNLYALLHSEDWNHYTMAFGANYDGVINVNIIVPCVLSPGDKPYAMSTNGASNAVVLTQQKLMEDDSLWAVVDCPYCGSKVRLSHELAKELAECLRSREHNKDYNEKVAKRILDGYAGIYY